MNLHYTLQNTHAYRFTKKLESRFFELIASPQLHCHTLYIRIRHHVRSADRVDEKARSIAFLTERNPHGSRIVELISDFLATPPPLAYYNRLPRALGLEFIFVSLLLLLPPPAARSIDNPPEVRGFWFLFEKLSSRERIYTADIYNFNFAPRRK